MFSGLMSATRISHLEKMLQVFLFILPKLLETIATQFQLQRISVWKTRSRRQVCAGECFVQTRWGLCSQVVLSYGNAADDGGG